MEVCLSIELNLKLSETGQKIASQEFEAFGGNIMINYRLSRRQKILHGRVCSILFVVAIMLAIAVPVAVPAAETKPAPESALLENNDIEH